MCYVGDMYANLPVPVIQTACGKGVVEVFRVLRVDREGCYPPEILPVLNFLRRDRFRDLIRRFLYRGRIFVRQSEFGKDRVHLGGILSGDT